MSGRYGGQYSQYHKTTALCYLGGTAVNTVSNTRRLRCVIWAVRRSIPSVSQDDCAVLSGRYGGQYSQYHKTTALCYLGGTAVNTLSITRRLRCVIWAVRRSILSVSQDDCAVMSGRYGCQYCQYHKTTALCYLGGTAVNTVSITRRLRCVIWAVRLSILSVSQDDCAVLSGRYGGQYRQYHKTTALCYLGGTAVNTVSITRRLLVMAPASALSSNTANRSASLSMVDINSFGSDEDISPIRASLPNMAENDEHMIPA